MANKLFILSLFITFYITSSFSQVTIGLSEKASPGALLQLKNIENVTDDSENSTKGMMLPRVALYKPNDLTDILNDQTSINVQSYIGLMVYNTTESVYFCPGIHIWNGEKWSPIPEPSKIPNTTMTDSDGNQYEAKWYGSACRGTYWTTSNLYTTKDSLGIDFTEPLRINPAKVMSTDVRIINNKSELDSNSNPLIEYELSGIIIKDTYPLFAKKFGLLYDWNQAKRACPRGWHLATVDDWDILAEMLFATVDENNNYLSIGKHLKADDLFYKDVSFTGYNTSEYNNGNCPWGGDNTLGFSAYPSGAVLELSGVGVGSSNFGIHAYWWTADASSKNPALTIDQGVHFNADALYRGENYPSYFFSARCVSNK